MYRSPLKPVLLGLLLGVALIAIPFFLLKAALFFLLLGAMFRFVGRRIFQSRQARFGAHSYAYGMAWHPAFTDTIRGMSEEDYSSFRQKLADDQPYASGQKTTIAIQ